MTLPPLEYCELSPAQDVLAGALLDPATYTPHPGELAWWVFHQDPRQTPLRLTVADGVVIVRDPAAVTVLGAGDAPRADVLERELDSAWVQTVGWVLEGDAPLETLLTERGYRPNDEYTVLFERDLEPLPVDPVVGFEFRPLAGEHEAWSRREASHGAFRSTMEPEQHHERYLRFMRSPGYSQCRDLVAVSSTGEVGAFLVWWGDAATGIGQLEPLGTHPAFQRRGLGRALMAFALDDMATSGMAQVRVMTDSDRPDALGFYRGVGFEAGPRRVRAWSHPDGS